MSTTIATLKAMIVADASGLVDGLSLTKKDIRDAARVVDESKGAWERYEEARRKATQWVAGDQMTADQAASWLIKQNPEFIEAERKREAAAKAREAAELAMLDRIKTARAQDERDAARYADKQIDYMRRLEMESAKIRRFGAQGLLSPEQVRGSIRDAERRLIPVAELAPTKVKQDLSTFRVPKDMTKDVTDLNKAFGVMPLVIDPATLAMRSMTAGGVALAGALTTIGIVSLDRLQKLDELGDSAARLGMSASALSEIRGAAFLGDVDPAVADNMIQKLLVAVGQEKVIFAELGLDVEKLRQQNPAAIFDATAEAINKLPTKSEQMSAIAEAFSRAGPDGAALVARFGELSQAMRDSGATASGQLVDGVGAADESMKRLVLSAEAFANTLAGIGVGPLTKVLEVTNKIASAGAFEHAGGFAFGLLAGAPAGALATDAMLKETDANRKAVEQERLEGSMNAIEAALEQEAEATMVSQDKIAEARKHAFKHLLAEEERFEKDLQQARVRDAIRAIDEEEAARKKASADRWDEMMRQVDEGAKIVDSLRTPAEATQDRMLADFDALRRGGLDSPEARERVIRRAAGEVARGDSGGAGAPGADKGSRAAREAIIGAKLQQDQLTELRRIEDHLRIMMERGGVVVEELAR